MWKMSLRKSRKTPLFLLTGSFLHDTALTPHFSHGTEHSKGTWILQRPNSLFSSSVQLIDPDGRLVIVKIREGEEDLFLASVESDVLNAGFMTNYFQVSRGVCQLRVPSEPSIVCSISWIVSPQNTPRSTLQGHSPSGWTKCQDFTVRGWYNASSS